MYNYFFKTRHFNINFCWLFVGSVFFAITFLFLGAKNNSVLLYWSPATIPKIATIAKESVIFEAVYDRPGASKEQLEVEVMEPIIDYLKILRRGGFIVIDTTTDSDGRMSVSALPEGSIDLTAKLKEIVKLPTH